MIRRRLSWVLIFLAVTILLQALGSTLALREAEKQIVRGRIASDLHRGFVEISATKQRLHTWVAQLTLRGGGDVAERDRLINQMRRILTDLQTLSQEAQASQLASQQPQEQLQREVALNKLQQSIQVLQEAIYQARPLQADLPAKAAWDSLSQMFEYADGYDLRQLIAQSIARESVVMARERAAADQALQQIRLIWLGVSGMLALLALIATVYFGRALRSPLQALADGAQALAQGWWQHRIVIAGKDEFSAVATSMNSMAQQLEQHNLRQAAERSQLEDLVKARTAELHYANESLRQADVRRRQLLADISHELRTPTTAIRGEAEVTLRSRTRSDDEYREALARIVQTSRELGSVIDDLLSMARMDLESLSLIREPIDMSLPLSDAWTQASALAAASGVQLICEPSEPVAGKVMGDRQRLRQLVLLLLDNAIRYSHAGGIVKLTIDQTNASQLAQDAWRIVVSDEGIGISADELPLVFERHFRGQHARDHRASGSGLGLPIALTLAIAHGGQLTLKSELGKGTQAELILPSLPALAAALPWEGGAS
jgi:two-component system OmpR family sensor kinase